MPNYDWPRPVVHFQIHAKDKPAQETFYREMFDWDIKQREGAPISIIPEGKGPPPNGTGGSIIETGRPAVLVYIQVADLGASLKKAEELGGKIAMPPIDVPNGPTLAQIQDPEGNLVGLVQM